MTDDIVLYLRLSRTRFNRHAEAADEIERLRKESKLWNIVAESLARQLGKVEYAYTEYDDVEESLKL